MCVMSVSDDTSTWSHLLTTKNPQFVDDVSDDDDDDDVIVSDEEDSVAAADYVTYYVSTLQCFQCCIGKNTGDKGASGISRIFGAAKFHPGRRSVAD